MNDNLLENDSQPVRNFIADLLEQFNDKIEVSDEPTVQLEYFGAKLEIKLISFDGIYEANNRKSASTNPLDIDE
ncbi:hypothetical protein OAP63_18625 [Vibrio sp.]|uniref:Uncharacterized protein n=1 Tax=Vibrio viridaestus TaxID=2487322 RepID=A0A3N9TJX1_9VIBR|nr:hypothetical protein [Vibrio viridaestus]MDC0612749.1 hypothetical protein [Vibrio sp.]RQW64471.1 hypothetical protein EES38_00010 [Vibrio viridaestus]